jgi:thiamine pyrophosphate-dependent acetolactate synthase large subunit-like protein
MSASSASVFRFCCHGRRSICYHAEHPLRVGPFGVYGPRAGNFVVQNADLIIALGTRLSQNLTGGILSSFARSATIAMVDADESEMSKFEGRGISVERADSGRAWATSCARSARSSSPG